MIVRHSDEEAVTKNNYAMAQIAYLKDTDCAISDTRRTEAMVTTSLAPKITTSAQVNDGVGSFRHLLVDKLVTIIFYEGKPVTVWGVATRLGNCYAEQVLAILDELTAEGTLGRFRTGFSNYYASPRVALTEKGPAFRTIISDSLKSLFLSCRYKVIGKLKGASKCSRTT